MLEKISQLPMLAYFAVTGFIRELKKDERGLSGVVVAVLLILVAVLAVSLLWEQLSTWLQEFWEKIVGKTAVIN